jgi:hypothetical protein
MAAHTLHEVRLTNMADSNSNELDRFYDLLSAQAKELTEQGKALATIAQSQVDTKERLFGAPGTPGIITYLADKNTALTKDISTLTIAVNDVRADRRVDKAYVIGAATIISLATKGLLTKLGWHF